MIEVDGLHKSFGDVIAVAGVRFDAADGRVTGLLGPNGAGKTTTLRMLYGLIRPDRGTCKVDGIVVADDPAAAQAKLGVLPDAKGLYPRLTGREHMRYFGRLHGLAGAQLEQRIEALIERLDMRAFADRRTQGFSQGQRMKVALARAMVHDPKNVLLDEPTNGLDVMSTRSMRALIRDLREEGRCVLFSSHIMQEVSALCDHIVIIADGKVVAQGSADSLRAQAGTDSLEDAFVILTGIDDPAATQISTPEGSRA